MGAASTAMNGDSFDSFLDLVQCAREIVLPGATGPIVPAQRPAGAVAVLDRSGLGDCIDLTDGMPAYGC